MRRLLNQLKFLILIFLALNAKAATHNFSLTAEERQWIADNPVVAYSYTVSWPMDYQDGDKHIGLSRDFLDKLSEITGLRFALASELKRPVQLISAISPELASAAQLKHWRFSQRWFSASALVITNNQNSMIQSLDDLKGKRIAVRNGTLYENWLSKNKPDLILVSVNHMRDVFQKVYDGEADVGLGTDLVMRPLLWRYYSHKLAIAGQISELATSFTMGVRVEDPLLLNIINKALAAIPAAEANDIYHRWAGDMKLGSPTIGVIFSLYQWEIFAFFILIIFLGLLLQRAIVLRKRAIDSEARKTQFLAMMSHEIRTPMNAMIAALELLKQPASRDLHVQYLDLACSSSRSLLDMLNGILDYSKVTQNKMVLERQPLALADLLQTVCDSHLPLAAQKGLALTLDIDEGLRQQWFIGDAHRLRQIANNLISNAIKFTNKGAVSVSLKEKVTSGKEMSQIILAVRDTGIGIEPAAQKTLFDAWTQVDSTAERHYSGSGLGLWICWQLVNLMRGSLSCISEPGWGSTFIVCLKLKRCEAQPQRRKQYLPRFSKDTTLLVIEDHPAAQQIIRGQLETLGCQVQQAMNGQQALQLLEDENYYDAILLDINLPDISGYEVARRIRELEQQHNRAAIPLVAISAMSDGSHYQQCQTSRIDAVLVKPILLQALGDCLRRWCHLDIQYPATPAMAKEDSTSEINQELKNWLEEDLHHFIKAAHQLNPALLAHYAHRLRGSALMYQFNELAEIAEDIESTLRRKPVLTPEQIELWETALRQSVTSITHPSQ